MKKLLLVEDDDALREAIGDYLEAKGDFLIATAPDGDTAMELIFQNTYDLLLLDIMLPGTDGYELCRFFRKHSDVPVIFLTACAQDEEKIHGFDLGCDDYLTKPFSLAELYVRIRALLRRTKGEGNTLCCGEIQLSPVTGVVTVQGQRLDLPRREFQLLEFLIKHKNQLVSRDTLLDQVWGLEFEGSDRVVDNHIRKLRKALGPEAGHIRTVFGMGYRMEG